jgi:hypothetical protein
VSVRLFTDKKWSFSNVDVVALTQDSDAQRKERTEFLRIEGEYLAARERFGAAQDERYQRFSAALNAARGAFKNDRTVLRELEGFKRSVQKARKSEADFQAQKPVSEAPAQSPSA